MKKSSLILFVLLLFFPFYADDGDEIEKAVSLLPEEYRKDVEQAIARAGDNRKEIVAAIKGVKEPHRKAIGFLVANMPERDLKELKKSFLVENIEYAYKARENTSWGKEIPDEIFLNYVLPYVNLNEKRDNWRKDFYEKFLPVAKKCKTMSEAVLKLNKEVFETLNVKYHPTKRPKPDQSPYESVQAGFASCTGLSVLLIDACRAVCIPARMAGIPMWTDNSGNHNWVEVWDGEWYFVGASEPTPLNETWFVEKAKKADASNPRHRIYAASFKKTDSYFPLVWDASIKYVSAIDVTKFYTTRRKVEIEVLEKEGGEPQKSEVTIRLKGEEIVAKKKVVKPTLFELAGGLTYEVEVKTLESDKKVKKEISVSEEEKTQKITICLE
ncbi:MAG: transglutaminase-like domain-containing protein [Planctomycetota bacterium]|nr:transglutaminase-like domain-containing protein [Planctomycetota bacterium]